MLVIVRSFVTANSEERHTASGAFSRMKDKKGFGKSQSTDGSSTKEKSNVTEISSVREEKETKKDVNPALLRKRTASTAEVPKRRSTGGVPGSPDANGNGPSLKPGQSILEQIGTPDHCGWMRKKGERYAVWKSRYFVLKGPHLYYMRSDSKDVRDHLVLFNA